MTSEALIRPINHLGTVTVQLIDFDRAAFNAIALYRLVEMVADAEVAELMLSEGQSQTIPVKTTIENYKIVISESSVYSISHQFKAEWIDIYRLMVECGINTDRVKPIVVRKKRWFRNKHVIEITFKVF